MQIKRPEDIESQEMTMPGAKSVSMRLLHGRGDGVPNFAMRHFTVEPGGHTPLHEHNYEHEVVVVAGEGEVTGREGDKKISAGDTLYVSPNETHQFRNTSDKPLQFICLVPIAFDCGGDMQQTPGS